MHELGTCFLSFNINLFQVRYSALFKGISAREQIKLDLIFSEQIWISDIFIL